MLPDIPFTKIMLMVGLQSIDSLHRCRQVCRTWNEKILWNIWENLINKDLIRLRINADWSYFSKFKYLYFQFPPYFFKEGRRISRLEAILCHIPSSKEISHIRWLEKKGVLATEVVNKLQDLINMMFKFDSNDVRVITYAACLAHQGLFKDEILMLENVDLSLISGEQLTSLASCVTRINIKNVSGCDLSYIFKGLQMSSKIYYLNMSQQSLEKKETQALVQAMESRVQVVTFGVEGEMKLDIKALTEYSGQGKCREIMCNEAIVTSHREELETWAKSHNWTFFESLVFNSLVFVKYLEQNPAIPLSSNNNSENATDMVRKHQKQK